MKAMAPLVVLVAHTRVGPARALVGLHRLFDVVSTCNVEAFDCPVTVRALSCLDGPA